MNEEEAKAVAKALGGEDWHSGGGIYLVMFWKQDGRLVVISDDVVCEYKNEEAFDNGDADTSVLLR